MATEELTNLAAVKQDQKWPLETQDSRGDVTKKQDGG